MLKIKLESEYEDLDKYEYYGNIYYFKKNTDIIHNPYDAAIIDTYGSKAYLIENKYHRLDGPAIIYSNGVQEYYINDKELTEEEFELHPRRLKFLDKEYLLCLI